MINELSMSPFNRNNCFAMLNALYPPMPSHQPSPLITIEILNKQREDFLKYINLVERKGLIGRDGTNRLENLIQQGRRSERNDATGWPTTKEAVENFLRTANAMIDECSAITGVDVLIPEVRMDIEEQKRKKKTDSGVSFISEDRPSSSNGVSAKDETPVSPVVSVFEPPKGGSTLERIAREIRRMREKKKEEERPLTPVVMSSNKLLRKMKSNNSLAFFGNGDSRAATSRSGTPTSYPSSPLSTAEAKAKFRTWQPHS
jgi:hypothetical protein